MYHLNMTNMKKTIITLVFAALIGFVYADNDGAKAIETPAEPISMVTLAGSVADLSSGESLAGVEVTIEGTDIKTYTDFDGNFEFKEVKPGKYNLIASFISYKKSLVENFETECSENTVDIKLESAE